MDRTANSIVFSNGATICFNGKTRNEETSIKVYRNILNFLDIYIYRLIVISSFLSHVGEWNSRVTIRTERSVINNNGGRLTHSNHEIDR